MVRDLLVSAALASVLVTPALTAQPTPTQCELLVNVPSSNVQRQGVVAHAADGSSAVAFRDHGSGRVLARRFAADGSPLGEPLEVNPAHASSILVTDLATDPGGAFWITWSEKPVGADVGEEVYARRLGTDGSFLGAALQINAFTARDQRAPSVAASATGSVFAWSSDRQDGDGRGVFCRHVAADGTLGAEQQVNLHTPGHQSRPRVARNDAGEFLVVWSGAGAADADGVFGRLLAADGTPQGGEFQIDDGSGASVYPDVEGDGSGFQVVWSQRAAAAGSPQDLLVRRVDSSGPAGSPVPLTDDGDADSGRQARLERLANGEFVVAWQEGNELIIDGYWVATFVEVAARKLDAAGVPTGAQFQVNSTAFPSDVPWYVQPSVAAAPVGGEFAVVWNGPGALDDFGVLLQRFDGPTDPLPADLAVEIQERADPADHQAPFWYAAEVTNQTFCDAREVALVQQLPPEITATGVVADAPWDCQLVASELDCRAEVLPTGRSRVRVDATLSDSAPTLATSAQVSAASLDPEPANDQDTETTQVVLCYSQEVSWSGKGRRPAIPAPNAPCEGGRRLAGQVFDISAEPATGGWRVGGWSGTDDDASTSRFNQFTMPAADSQVSVDYVFDDLVSWWTLDTVLDDLAGNNPLEFGSGPLQSEPGFDGPAFVFDGDDFLFADDDPSLDPGTGDLTFGVWLRTSGAAGVQSILDKRADAPVRGFHAFLLDGRPGIQLADGSQVRNFIGQRGVADGAYHQVVFSVDRDRSDGLRIYVDGSLDSVFDPRAVAGPLGNAERLILGRRSDALGADAFFDGALDEPFLVARALGLDDVTESLGVAGRWRADFDSRDDTAFGNDAFLLRDATYTTGACGRGAFLLGSRDAVTVPYDSSLSPDRQRLTWAAWLRVDPDNSSDPRRVIQHGLEGNGDGYGIVLAAGSPALRLYQGAGPGYLSGLPDLRDGQWHFLAVTLEAGGVNRATFYLDDRPPVTVQLTPFAVLDGSTESFFFGSTGTDGMTGAIDEVQHFRRILRPVEIAALRDSCRRPLFVDGFEAGNLSAWSSVEP